MFSRRSIRTRRRVSNAAASTESSLYPWYDFDRADLLWYNTAGAWGAGRDFLAPSRPTTGGPQTAANDAAAEAILAVNGSYLLVETGTNFGDLDITATSDIRIHVQAGASIASITTVNAINRLWIEGVGRYGSDRVFADGADGVFTFLLGVSNLIIENCYWNAPYKYGLQGPVNVGFVGNNRALLQGYFIYPQRASCSNDLFIAGNAVWVTDYSGPDVTAGQPIFRLMDSLVTAGNIQDPLDHNDFNEGIVCVYNQFRARASYICRIHGMSEYAEFSWNTCDGGGFLVATGTPDAPDVKQAFIRNNDWRMSRGPNIQYGYNNVNAAEEGSPDGPVRNFYLTGNTFRSDVYDESDIVGAFTANVGAGETNWVRSGNVYLPLGSGTQYVSPPGSPLSAIEASAGPDASPEQDAPYTLAGAAVGPGAGDYGIPLETIAYTWSQTSGTGTGDFTDESDADTAVVFDTLGVHVLQLQVSDGFVSDTDSVTLTVVEPAPPVAGSLEMDGTNDFMRISSSIISELGQTFCGWFLLPSDLADGINAQLYCVDDNSSAEMGIWLSGSTNATLQSLACTGPGFFRFTSNVITAGTWYFYAWTVAGDGTVIQYRVASGGSSFTTTTDTYDGTMTPTRMSIGCRRTDGNKFPGRFTGLKAWNAVLTDSELLAERLTREPVVTANLYAYWPCGSDGVTNDASGNGHNWTVTGALATSVDEPTELAA